MNKKVSTLLTLGLVLGGSLLSSSAFAQTQQVPAGTKLDGKTYYYLKGKGATAEEFLDGAKTSDGKFAIFSTTPGASFENGKINESALWSVNAELVNGVYLYTFTNKESGLVLAFKSDGSALASSATDAKITKLSWALNANGTYKTNGADIISAGTSGTYGIKYLSNQYSVANSATVDMSLYLVKDYIVDANTAFSDQQGSFSLEYKIGDDAPTQNIFGQDVIAIEVTAEAGKYPAGTYFVTNAEKDLTANKTYSSSDETKLNKLTFIAVDPKNDWNINELKKDGEGMKFKTIRGSQMVKADGTEKADETTANNACFKVYTNPNQEGKVKLTVTPYVNVLNETTEKDELTKAATMTVAAVEDQKDIFVTTVADETNYTVWTTLGSANVVKVSDFLKADEALVYNILFTSKTKDGGETTDYKDKPSTYSEYNKYLSVGGATTKGIVAQGKDYINLNAPQNQWIVTNADKDENTVTFTNRETGDFFTAKLVKAGTNYRLVNVDATTAGATSTFKYAYENEDGEKTYSTSVCNLEGTEVNLVSAKVDKFAGYVATELDKLGLVKMAFAIESNINPVDLYVTGETATDALNKDAAKAAMFEVVKFTEVGDTLVRYNDFAYWDASKKEVKIKEEADTMQVVSYAFKAVGKDAAGKVYKNQYLKSDLTIDATETDYAEDAPRFVVKVDANGSYSLVPCEATDDVEEMIENNTYGVYGLPSNVNGSIDITVNIYSDKKVFFSINGEVLGNSYNHVPQHVTLKDAKVGGYVAVAEEGNGIVAPVSELKAEYTKADLTFWLDTTDTDAHIPAFYISKGGKEFMYHAQDSAYIFDGGVATDKVNEDFLLSNRAVRAVFNAATLKDENTMVTTFNGKEVELTAENGLNDYKFNIVENEDGDYVIRSVGRSEYLFNLNGELGFTSDAKTAMIVEVETVEAPTSNEGVSASEVAVVAQNGSVVVKNAAGKNVVVSTILGQVVANEVLTSDNATINVPAGIVVVAVEGESFKVNVK